MGVKQPVYQMKIAGAAAPGANSQVARELCFGSCGESRSFFVTNMNPLELAAAMERIGDRVETVAHKPKDSLHSDLGQGLDYFICQGSGQGHTFPKSFLKDGHDNRCTSAPVWAWQIVAGRMGLAVSPKASAKAGKTGREVLTK
jgi:hypothetical protein